MTTGETHHKSSHSFYERQKFKNLLLYALLITIEVFFIAVTMEKYMVNRPWGNISFTAWILIIFTATVPTPLLVCTYLAYFESLMNDEGIFYRWAPFKKNYRMIEWKNVKEISIIDLRSAGFMWRFSSKYGEVHYLGGGYGIQIKMVSGRRKLLGTRKPEELNRILIRIAGSKYQVDKNTRSSWEF